MSDTEEGFPQQADDRERADLSEQFEKRYDLLDDSTPEPINLAPTNDDTPVVNPFSPSDED